MDFSIKKIKEIKKPEEFIRGDDPYSDPEWVARVEKEDRLAKEAVLKAAKDRCKTMVSFSDIPQERWDMIFGKKNKNE